MTLPEPLADGGPFLDEAGRPRAFVIVSSARSGSNLLVSYLRQVSRAACFGEILRGEFPGKEGWDRLVTRLDLPPEASALHRSDLTAFWELFLSRALQRRHWAGAKVFYYHREADPVWTRFAAADHRVIHLWRDATLEQYVSRLLAVESGEWKSAGGGTGSQPGGTAGDQRGRETGGGAPSSSGEPRVAFDRVEYLRYRAGLREGFERTRARYGGSDHYVELEYRQLSDHELMERLFEQVFGERIAVEETLRRQRGRPKLDYLVNPVDAEPFVADSLSAGFGQL